MNGTHDTVLDVLHRLVAKGICPTKNLYQEATMLSKALYASKGTVFHEVWKTLEADENVPLFSRPEWNIVRSVPRDSWSFEFLMKALDELFQRGLVIDPNDHYEIVTMDVDGNHWEVAFFDPKTHEYLAPVRFNHGLLTEEAISHVVHDIVKRINWLSDRKDLAAYEPYRDPSYTCIVKE